MKVPLFIFVCFLSIISSNAFTIIYRCTDDSARDYEVLWDFINSKRSMNLAEKKGEFKLSGTVEIEYYNRREEQDLVQLRGDEIFGGKKRGPNNQFDAVVNLKFDYRYNRAWAHARLKATSELGIQRALFGRIKCSARDTDKENVVPDPAGSYGSGDCNTLCLKKLFFGYKVFERCGDSINVIVGRRALDDAFTSRIEFGERFDGIEIHYSHDMKPSSNFYIKLAPFLVDERVNHFAYVGEIGLLDPMESRFDIRYSYIDWTHGRSACRPNKRHPLGWQFQNSQFSLAYNFPFDTFNRKVQLFGACLYNHAARGTEITHGKRKPWGWYAGIITGEKIKKNDWWFDLHYEMVQKNAVSDCDQNGIDRGKLARNGKTNYKGFSFEVVYMITDNLSVDTAYDMAWAESRDIQGQHEASVFEFDLIYVF